MTGRGSAESARLARSRSTPSRTAICAAGDGAAQLQRELAFELEERDITADDALHRAYFERIPVVALDGEELCEYFVDEALVRERLESRR